MIPYAFCLQISSKEAYEITSQSFDDLQSTLKSRKLTCVKVLHAYEFVAAEQNERLNFIVEPVLGAEVGAE